jgi:hypothetical protein
MVNMLSPVLQLGSTYDEQKSINTWGGTAGAATSQGFLALYTSPYALNTNSFTFELGNTHIDSSNDFQELVYLQQFNELTNVINNWMWRLYKGQDLQTKKDGSGTLTEAQCQLIEQTIQNKIIAALVGPKYIPAPPSSAGQPNTFITVSRTQNVVAAPSTLVWTYRMWVDAYVKSFSATGSLSL